MLHRFGMGQKESNLATNVKYAPSKTLKHSPVLRKGQKPCSGLHSQGLQELFELQCPSDSPNGQ